MLPDQPVLGAPAVHGSQLARHSRLRGSDAGWAALLGGWSMKPAIPPVFVIGVVAGVLGGLGLAQLVGTAMSGSTLRPEMRDGLLGLAALVVVTAVAAGLGRTHSSSVAPAHPEPGDADLLAIPAVLLVFIGASWASAVLVVGEWSWVIAGALFLAIYAGCVYRESRSAGSREWLELRGVARLFATHAGGQPVPIPARRRDRRRRGAPVSDRIPRAPGDSTPVPRSEAS